MYVRSAVVVLSLAVTALFPTVAGSTIAATDVAGVPADRIGLHGPVEHHLHNLELVGHTPIPDENGVPLGNSGAVALLDDCAFVGRWHDYTGRTPVQIIDVADPSAPAVVGSVPDSVAPGGVSREIRVYDNGAGQPTATMPPDMLIVMQFAQSIPNRVNNKLLIYTFEDGDCRAPVLTGTFDMRAFRGHEFFLLDVREPTVAPTVCLGWCGRVLVFATTPVGPPNVMAVDITDPAAPQLVGLYDAGIPVASATEVEGQGLGNYAHSISFSGDGRIAYLSYWDAGFFSLDASTFTQLEAAGALLPRGAASIPHDYSGPEGDAYGNTHSAVEIPGKNAVVVGDEIYITTDGCPFGWMRILSAGDATTPPSQIGEFRLAENEPENCVTVADPDPVLGGSHRAANVRNAEGTLIDGTFSMHNQTVSESFVYASWYGAGLRVVDVSDPAAPVEVGSFVPAPVPQTATTPSTPAPTYGRDDDASNDWWVAMWSYPIVRDGLIYVTDTRNGLYILRPTDGAPFASEVASIGFLEGNSNIGDPLARAHPGG